jgi:hypothetical protein
MSGFRGSRTSRVQAVISAFDRAATSIRYAQDFYLSKPFSLEDMSDAKEFFLGSGLAETESEGVRLPLAVGQMAD